jgi:hypothetical protein
VTLDVLDVGPLARLRVRAGGRAVDADLRPVKASGKLAVGVARVGSDGRLRVSLESDTWRPVDISGRAPDDRELGVYVHGVELALTGDDPRATP